MFQEMPDDMSLDLPPFLQGLNTRQEDAVRQLDGPVLVLAGAGAGKTRVLTTRLANLLYERRAGPGEILCVTFTNKAAREMRERVAGLIGPMAEGLRFLGTFHSVSAQILRRHAELVGLTPQFTILDTDDQLRLIKQILRAENIDDKKWTPKQFANLVDAFKNRGWTPEKLPPGEGNHFAQGRGAKLYTLYQDRLRTLNACDFGDLLLHCLTIFLNHPDVLASYQRRLKYILVDEYQDTNVAQYLWLRLLAQAHHNICVVGDDDQSIYGWRGAEVDNILRFETDFPGAHVVRLEQNYRSTGHILGAASSLIAENQRRLGKTLWTEADMGTPVRVRAVWDGEAEARLIGDDLEAWLARGRKLSDAAILVRAAFQMRAFEERFITLGLPYVVIGGPRFFERQEIRDAHAYLRLMVADDDLAFERVVNTPKRGIGDATLQKLMQMARMTNMPLMSTVREVVQTDELPARARNALARFLNDIDRWRQDAQSRSHQELTELILDDSGYTAMWQADKSPNAQTRLENLKELVQSLATFDSLPAYLEHVALVMDLERDAGEDAVKIMTLHAAKGLEFPLVFLPGWEDGIFPSQRALDESGQAALEEERRLAYVGLTRAREDARISHAANRLVYGSWQSSLPSRFVDELPEQHVDTVSELAPQSGGWSGYGQMGSGRAAPLGHHRNKPALPQRRRGPVHDEPSFHRGALVRHGTFGIGEVIAVEGNKLVVSFDDAGDKRVMANFLEAVE